MSRLDFVASKKIKIHKEKNIDSLMVANGIGINNKLYFKCNCGHKIYMATTNTETLNISFTFQRPQLGLTFQTKRDEELCISNLSFGPSIQITCPECFKEFGFGYEKGGDGLKEATKRVYE